jgi:phage gp16-like protein
MNTAKTDPRRALITKIHIARSQLGMADDSYRANLAHYANGKTSCTQMTVTELEAVLSAFKKLGFKAKPKAPTRQSEKKYSPSTADGPKDERSVIRAIWIFMYRAGFLRDGSETALNTYVTRQTAQLNGGAGIQSVQWLEGKEAVLVLESLKKWCRREMYRELQKLGANLWPAMSYQQLLNKWEKLKGTDK